MPTLDKGEETLLALELIDLEVLSVLRKQVKSAGMTLERAERALPRLAELPMRRAPHRPLLRRCWELRQTGTADDAAYVALPGVRCHVTLLDW